MSRKPVLVAAICGAIVLSACSAKYAQVPARLDLHRYGRVAVVTFDAHVADTALATLATRQLAETVLAHQLGVEVIELSLADTALDALARRGVPVAFLGELAISEMKPSGSLSSRRASLQTGITVELSVKLVSTESGGTLWRSSAAADRTTGRVTLTGGGPSISMRDRDAAYDDAVISAVRVATTDLRPTWVRQ
jgi:hypothetical protein